MNNRWSKHSILLLATVASFGTRKLALAFLQLDNANNIRQWKQQRRCSFPKISKSLVTSLSQVDDDVDTVAEIENVLLKSKNLDGSSGVTLRQNNNNNNKKKNKEPHRSRPPRKKNLRMQLFSILNKPIVEVAAASAVLLSTFLVALNTLNNLSTEAYYAIDQTLFGLNIIFAFDFFVRWYAAGQFKLKYLTKPLALIDIFVVLIPLFLGSVMPMLDEMGLLGDAQTLVAMNFNDSSGLQVLLLLRVLRLKRVLTDINTFGRFEVALGLRPNDVRPYQLQLARVLLSIFTLLSVASGLIYEAEHYVNPDIPDYFTALYFGLTTLTTVGYGDIVPMTFQGRLVVCGSILVGVAVLPAQAAKLVDAVMESQSESERFKIVPPPRAGFGTLLPSPPKDEEASATDGMGPSGKPIDVPQDEGIIEDVEVSNILCSQCGASYHRDDASFCWSCGSEL